MKNGLVYLTTILLLLLFITSCGESFLLSDENSKENNIEITSLLPGGVLEKGEIVNFRVLSSSKEDTPDKLEISIYSKYGERLGGLENTNFALNEELSLNLFETLSTDSYTLEFILYMGNEVLCEQEIDFFYTAEKFTILGIESFPPSVFPGATVLLSTTISIPEDSDPFLRWSVDDKVITKGLMSAGTDKILWPVPQEEGVYSVKVELFPIAPDKIDDYPFASEIFMDVELYVSEISNRPSRYLYPENSYYILYHFDGNLIDTATGRTFDEATEKRTEAVPIGEPQLITVEEDFGYYIDNFSGFKIEECILPVIEGELKPFTLSLGLELDPAQTDRTILTCKTYDNLFNLTIYIGPESYIYASIQSGSQELIIPSNINAYAIEYRFVLSLSVQPEVHRGEKSFTTIWYLDGMQTNVLSFDDTDIRISSDGETIIGGEKGFSGVIDELGVYFIDKNRNYTSDPDLYKKAIRQMYGSDSIFAQGFDGIYIPESIETQKDTAFIKNGTLIMSSTLSALFPSVNLKDKDLKIIIDFGSPVPENCIISLSWQDEISPFLDITTSGTFNTPEIPVHEESGNLPEQNKTSAQLKNMTSSFYVKINEKGSTVSFPGEEFDAMKITPPGKDVMDIILKIQNNDSLPIIIESITVVQE